ncbi:YbaK/EbsC family protein [Lactiplantibacillus paraplantarum]|uniref:YbaK/EbsC family protein n=1 Tax=Lactiplantibacillus paraplantarum TaxID=60520 RepID=UPI002073A8A5|nr:YbaK/EbsC family protein [Lactiplantibacillus paraplantarum]
MDKPAIYKFLEQRHIWHEITAHPAFYNMADLTKIDIPYRAVEVKNLFLHDDKKRNYYLISVKGDKRVNLKQFRKDNGTRPLSFASEQSLLDILSLQPGSVTPLGLLNDTARKVHYFIDQTLLDQPGLIGVHPNENTAMKSPLPSSKH